MNIEIGKEQLIAAEHGPDVSSEMAITASQELKNAFRTLRGTQIASRSTRAARAIAAVNAIRLPYPLQMEAMNTFHEAQELSRNTRGQMQAATCVFAPPHTGKTTAASNFVEVANDKATDGKRVLLISMGTGGGPLEMYRQTLIQLGEGFPATKDLAIMRARAIEAMIDAGVELLIIDEVHEAGRQIGRSSSFTAELKTLLNGGHVGIVLLGTDHAKKMIYADQELSMRTMAPCNFGALDWNNEEDRALWIGFLSALDTKMVQLGIVSSATNLADPELAMALWTVCQGVIGQLMNVMKQAIRISIYENREFITIDDLALAVEDRLIATNLCAVNTVDLLAEQRA
jgi:hypothetical protein